MHRKAPGAARFKSSETALTVAIHKYCTPDQALYCPRANNERGIPNFRGTQFRGTQWTTWWRKFSELFCGLRRDLEIDLARIWNHHFFADDLILTVG